LAICLLNFSESFGKVRIDPRASLFVIFVLLICLLIYDYKNSAQRIKDRF